MKELSLLDIHAVYNWPLKLLGLDYDPVSHLINLIHDQQFKIVFKEAIHGKFLFTLRVLVENLLRQEHRKKFFNFSFCSGLSWQFLFTFRVLAENLLRDNHRGNFLIFHFLRVFIP